MSERPLGRDAGAAAQRRAGGRLAAATASLLLLLPAASVSAQSGMEAPPEASQEEPIEEAPLDIDDGALRVRVVIGIAATTPHYDRRDPRELLSSACCAVEYADQAPKRIFLANS